MAITSRTASSFSSKALLEDCVIRVRSFGTEGVGAIAKDPDLNFAVGDVGVGTNLAPLTGGFNAGTLDSILLGVEFQGGVASDGVTIEPLILDNEALIWRRIKVGSMAGITPVAAPAAPQIAIIPGELVEVPVFGAVVFFKIVAITGTPTGAGQLIARPGRTRPASR